MLSYADHRKSRTSTQEQLPVLRRKRHCSASIRLGFRDVPQVQVDHGMRVGAMARVGATRDPG
jgi:hypothetical protein